MMDGTTKRILVADDDPAARTLARRRLEAEGYTVSLADDGQSALAAIARERPDLLVLDLMMPRIDGRAVIQDLRSRSETVGLPVIMISAQGATGSEAAAGADGYFPKPLDFPALVDQIRALLSRPTALAAAAPAPRSVAPNGAIGTGPVGTVTIGAGPFVGGGIPSPDGLIVFIGAKGGVGATTVAANIATALARSGRRTVLAETAAFHGSLPTILGIPARRRMDRLSLNSGSQLDQAAVADTLQTHASGLQVMFGPSGNQAPPTADGLIALWDALKAMTDTVVVDLDSAVDAFGQVTLRLADRIWVVTTPEPAGIERAAGLIQLLEQWGVRPQKIDVLVNQTSPAMVVGLADIAQQTERAIAIVVPASPEACFEATRRGVTLAEVDPGQPAAQALTAFSDALVQAAAAARG